MAHHGAQALGRASKKVTCSLWRCVLTCPLVLVTIGVFALSLGHHVTCLFNAGLCSSLLHMAMARMDQMPSRVSDEQLRVAAETRELTCKPVAKSSDGIARVIMLGTQKSGSTWMVRRLGTHPDISFGGEEMLRWCEAPGSVCSWAETAEKLENVFFEQIRRSGFLQRLTKLPADAPVPRTVVGFKLMYNHMPQEHRAKFADWCYCHGVTVIHMVRSASVESFWTLQAQLLDAADLGRNYTDRFVPGEGGKTAKFTSNRKALYLDPAHARDYVVGLYSIQRMYRMLLAHHAPFPIAYHELFYEDVKRGGEVAERVWNSIVAFLGLRKFPLKDTLVRVHPGTCKDKIENWREVKHALRGTESYYACEW
eukprot:TRINITY_DN14006_c0_g1_i1.p1 TRINITY_DN14006_c0_g1~~TRINITY_DN14006_c0_g1_i1.p1  ORF type:complete len:367 (-),score=45.27 TRINITY_DN14006_c0_g1_i1:205-1305(-)